MNYIFGDLIKMAKEGQFDIIVHGCNCFCTMGAGIAATIKKEFPAAYEADLKTQKGNKNKLGSYTFAEVKTEKNPSLTIINAYTQYHYNGLGNLFEYDGFQSILNQIKYNYSDKRIGFPLIGCGLAGGDKERILNMIKETLGDIATIVEFDQQPISKWKK